MAELEGLAAIIAVDARADGLAITWVSPGFELLTGYSAGEVVRFPIAHHDGNYRIGAEGLARLRAEDRIAFTYAETVNGAEGQIAGVLSENRRGLGLMPHPERAADPALGPAPGAPMLAGLVDALAAA